MGLLAQDALVAERAVGGCLWQRLGDCDADHRDNCNRQRYISGYQRRNADHAGHGRPELRTRRASALSTLAAGAHSLVATYAGDATHGAAQSSALAMTVTPLAVTIAPNPASILYGQAIPPLSGALTGVLPQDAGKVAAVFTSSAAALSPVGTLSHLRHAYRQRGGELYGRA